MALVYTDELGDRICGYIRAGVAVTNAAILAGVSESAIRSWVKKGEEGLEPYVYFYEKMQVAKAELQQELIDKLMHIARGHSEDNPLYTLRVKVEKEDGKPVVEVEQKDFAGMDPKVIMWLLEKRWPKEFGRLVDHKHKHNHKGGVGLNLGAGEEGNETPEFKILIVDPKQKEGE